MIDWANLSFKKETLFVYCVFKRYNEIGRCPRRRMTHSTKFTHFSAIFDLCSVITERLAGKVTTVLNYIYHICTLFCVRSSRFGFCIKS